jgi:diamine N-acetyltransferase
LIALKEVTIQNWFNIVMLRSGNDQENKIFEKNIASNCFSLAQSSIERNWVTKAIYYNETLVGFTMYGYSEELQGYEICRFMIDFNHQGKGYGKEGLHLVIQEMVNHFECEEILLSFHPENEKAKKLYVSLGFQNTGKVVKGFVDEHIYSIKTK